MVPADFPRHAIERQTVLLAEDEPIVGFYLAECFRERGISVIECASADEALDIVLAGGRVDALVTDVRMPGELDGLALARHARRARPGLPVVVVSGDAKPDEAHLADAFLRKPLVEETLCAVVERLIAGARSPG